MKWRRLIHPLVFFGAAMLVVAVVDETWLMPGPVSRHHAALEGKCAQCHPGFDGTPNRTCLRCKTKMKLVMDRGIHRFAPIKRCADCHVEHRTRAYPLASAWVDPRRFNHRWTGFVWGKFHQRLACDKCHLPGKPYRAVKPTCDGCHQDFTPGVWNHDKSRCRLDAVHAGLTCRACHVNKWGPGKKPSCVRCHPRDKYRPRRACLPGLTLRPRVTKVKR
ncbi:MAG: hypothetical protein KKC37_10405 [Proteobacteria bacterium]|nr:hypothetical protein [Pseudomonadota bacterium]